MKLRADITINGTDYKNGSYLSPLKVYPFFLFHMLAFGASGFMMAYFTDATPVGFLYMHGGFAILVYIIFYLTIFGPDEVKWMFINAAMGLFGIYCEIDWLLSLNGKSVASYPVYVHVIPFMYYILYTFLIRQAVLDFTGSRDDEQKKRKTERNLIAGSMAVYLLIYLL